MVCKLKDIAEALGVTVNTVSHALADKDDISAETKRKVREKAAELGYVANRNARFLRTGRTRTIAVVYDDYINPYYSIMTGLLQRALETSGYNMMIFTDTDDKALLRYKTAQNILSTGADAVISFLDLEPKARDLIRASGKPLLLVGRESVDPTVDCLTADDEIGGYLAARHLIEAGHRDVLMLCAADTVSCVQKRIDGYRRALEEAGIAFRPAYILYAARDGLYSGNQLIHKAVRSGLRFSAVFCFNDLLAYQAIAGLEESGLRVPDDVSVVGYDNLESHMFLPVGLDTVDTDKDKLAEYAARVMVDTLDGKRPVVPQMPPPRLIAGKTVRENPRGGVSSYKAVYNAEHSIIGSKNAPMIFY